MKLIKKILILSQFLIYPLFAENEDIVIKINSHEHTLDFSLKEQIQQEYLLQRDTLIKEYLEDNPKVEWTVVEDLTLGNKIESLHYTKGESDIVATIVLDIPDNSVHFNKEVMVMYDNE